MWISVKYFPRLRPVRVYKETLSGQTQYTRGTICVWVCHRALGLEGRGSCATLIPDSLLIMLSRQIAASLAPPGARFIDNTMSPAIPVNPIRTTLPPTAPSNPLLIKQNTAQFRKSYNCSKFAILLIMSSSLLPTRKANNIDIPGQTIHAG